jgi:hypothetical protein
VFAILFAISKCTRQFFFDPLNVKTPIARQTLHIDHVGESGNCSVLGKTGGPPQLSPPTPPVRDPFFTSENSQPEKNRLVSRGNGANTRQDYSLKLLFCQNIHFKSNKTVQYSGLLRASFFSIYYSRFFGKNGLQMPLAARYRDHVGEFGFWGV